MSTSYELRTHRIRASAHSFEAKAYGIVTAGYMDSAMRDFLVARDPSVVEVIDRTQRAASFFVDPTGETLGEMLQDQEGIAYAEFDLTRCIEPKQFHDVVGYYNRFDVFDLNVNRKRLKPITFLDIAGLPSGAEIDEGNPKDDALSGSYNGSLDA